jgi:hypothetical protein
MGRWSFRAVAANLAGLLLGTLGLLGAEPSGGLYLTTLPSAVDVWLDGRYVGRSPLLVDGLTVGEHRMTLTRTGWTPSEGTVNVEPSRTVTDSVVLTRAADVVAAAGTGTIAILGSGRVVTVTLDGAPAKLGKEGTIVASAGTHDLTLTGQHGKMARSVTVYPQMRTDVVFRDEGEQRSIVIAPADDYLPPSAYRFTGERLAVRYRGHDVLARLGTNAYTVDGRPVSYDAAPTLIGNRLYLPLELLTLLTGHQK